MTSFHKKKHNLLHLQRPNDVEKCLYACVIPGGITNLLKMAGITGFEPVLTVLETAVLPLTPYP